MADKIQEIGWAPLSEDEKRFARERATEIFPHLVESRARALSEILGVAIPPGTKFRPGSLRKGKEALIEKTRAAFKERRKLRD